MITCIDVDYQGTQAHIACLVFKDWTASVPEKTYTLMVNDIADYTPGEFYKRELPCILNILELVKEEITLVIVDGYVWLDTKNRPGLGAYLYKKMNEKIPVIGVAKNKFKGSDYMGEILRGDSQKPLFITAAGIELPKAMEHVQLMHGEFRIPTILKMVDQVCRNWTEK